MGEHESQIPAAKDIAVSVTRTSSSGSTAPSLKSPRTPRFAEATSVNSPIEPTAASKRPFDADDKPTATSHRNTQFYAPQPQPSDVGFGYIGDKRESGLPPVEMPMTPNSPLKSPLKSALKSPGAPPRNIPSQNPLSPTWKEEGRLAIGEKKTEKQQAKDLRVKIRIRMAKMGLRFTNFACSLIVLSMLSSAFSIFNATKHLPPRNNLNAWASGTATWPAILLLVIACVSLFMSVLIFWGYARGGHRRAEKVAVYYTTFAVGFFVFSILMWAIGAGVLNQGKSIGGGHDIWGWSCKKNARNTAFSMDVNYDLVCRMMNWSLVCAIIEIVVEVLTIAIYGVVFYRFYSKRQLRKTMAKRDTARSDLYLAQLRSQSAPNTPGLRSPGAPLSPSEGGYNPMYSPRFAGASLTEKGLAPQPSINEIATAGQQQQAPPPPPAAADQRYITAPSATQLHQPKPFTLQAPPKKDTTPKTQQTGFDPAATPAIGTAISSPPPLPSNPQIAVHAASPGVAPPGSPFGGARPENEVEHMPAAPGEAQYEAVPIPGAYGS